MIKIKIKTDKGTIKVCNTNRYSYPSDILQFVKETIEKSVLKLNNNQNGKK